MTYSEKAKKKMEILAKQKPVTLEEAKAQAKKRHEQHYARLRKELASSPIELKSETGSDPAIIFIDKKAVKITDHKQFGDKPKSFPFKQISSVGIENEGNSLYTLTIEMVDKKKVLLSEFTGSDVRQIMRNIQAMNEKVKYIR